MEDKVIKVLMGIQHSKQGGKHIKTILQFIQGRLNQYLWTKIIKEAAYKQRVDNPAF